MKINCRPISKNGEEQSPAALFDICAREAVHVHEIVTFKNWIRIAVRPLLPHGALSCVHGRIYGVGGYSGAT
jgi:hypothetical protein